MVWDKKGLLVSKSSKMVPLEFLYRGWLGALVFGELVNIPLTLTKKNSSIF